MELYPGLRNCYSNLYGEGAEIEDSPDQSRRSLILRLRNTVSQHLNASKGYLLDLGSGPQILEREFRGFSDNSLATLTYPITLDFAHIPRYRLQAFRRGVSHFCADGSNIPFKNNGFDFVISNMALDFMPTEAQSEVFRILKPGGHTLLNLHHPSLLDLYDVYLSEWTKNPTSSRMNTLAFWKCLRDNKIIFETPDHIKSSYESLGFNVIHIGEEFENQRISSPNQFINRWWAVDLRKPF